METHKNSVGKHFCLPQKSLQQSQVLSSVIALHRIACRVAGHWPCHTRPDWSRPRPGEEGDLKDFRVKHRLSAFGIRLTAGHVVYALKRQMTRRANDSGQMNEPSIFNHSIGNETVFYCISRHQRRSETNGCNQCCKLRAALRTRKEKNEIVSSSGFKNRKCSSRLHR